MNNALRQSSSRSGLRTSFTALTVAAALASYGAFVPSSAEAASGSPASSQSAVAGPVVDGVTPKQVAAAVAEIKHSGEDYETVVSPAGQRYISLDFGQGSTIYLPDTAGSGSSPSPATAAGGPELIGGGGGVLSPYVRFNRVDQSALLAGGGAAIAGAICLIPAVGQVACVVAGVIVAVATTYLVAYGRCRTSRPNLRVYVYPSQRNRNGCYA